jgi:DNA-directed RNA polymerase specialized sigma24 family protein
LEVLLERHATQAVSFARNFLANREDAEDVAQTALMQAANGLAANWRGEAWQAYLCACVRHEASRLRAQNLSRRRREQVVAEHNASKEAEMPVEQLELEESLAALREELANLLIFPRHPAKHNTHCRRRTR